VFVVHAKERATFERAQRVKAMERLQTRLVKLERRVAAGRLKVEAKIGAAAIALDAAARPPAARRKASQRSVRPVSCDAAPSQPDIDAQQ